jgi:hypothetical protein
MRCLLRLVLGVATLLVAASAMALEKETSVCPPLAAREIPAEILSHLHDWEKMANWDRGLQMALGVTGLAAALALSTFADFFKSPYWTKMLAFIAALCFGVLSAFDIGGKADAARTGWRHLNTAILKYQNNPKYTIDNLIDAYSDGEAMVGNVRFQAQGVSSGRGGTDEVKK